VSGIYAKTVEFLVGLDLTLVGSVPRRAPDNMIPCTTIRPRVSKHEHPVGRAILSSVSDCNIDVQGGCIDIIALHV